MKRAHCLIRTDAVHYRHEAFISGLRAVGFHTVDDIILDPGPGDVLVIWNRYSWFNDEATRYEAAGATVLVAENGYLGNDFAGDRWYAISKTHHNGAGHFPQGSPLRWDSLGVELRPYRGTGREILVLPQRGIGPAGVRMPDSWTGDVAARLAHRPYRIREHPGINACTPLEDDLRHAKAVITWGSGAALKALLLGIPCFHAFPQWIGAGASTPLDLADFDNPQQPDRLPTFQRLAWAMWRLSEIADGTAFRHLLSEAACTS